MFRIDRSANRIAPVQRRSFADLGFQERAHLQEWLAHAPQALGEDLLIIQKEFAGFDGTQERLDLLALDATGKLVVIENKRDDSGRGVIWQALRYAAYCSTLTTRQIIDIYRQHLGVDAAEAEARIRAFLGDEMGEEEALTLNPADTQRLILVAAEFRKEVTATALWLLNKRIDIKCIQVIPYQSGEDLYLDVQQLIPTPETGDFMIRLAEKSAEEERGVGDELERYKRRRAYWSALLERAEESGLGLLSGLSPRKTNWLSASCGISGMEYRMIINRSEARVHFEFLRPNPHFNKAMFDFVATRREDLQALFDDAVAWNRKDEHTSSQLVVATTVDFEDQSTWPGIIDWHLTRLQAFEAAMAPLLPELAERARGFRA